LHASQHADPHQYKEPVTYLLHFVSRLKTGPEATREAQKFWGCMTQLPTICAEASISVFRQLCHPSYATAMTLLGTPLVKIHRYDCVVI